MAERMMQFDNIDHIMNLFGNSDENIKSIESNVTVIQRKMDINILGEEADVEQAYDLIKQIMPSAKEAERILKNVSGIAFTRFTYRDVVRHELIRKIIKAYERYETAKNKVKK